MEDWNTLSDFIGHFGTAYNIPRCLGGVEEGKWKFYTTQEVVAEIRYLALGLKDLGLERGTCVGIMALPSPRWTMVALAVIAAGGVFVPLFPNISDENFVFEIKQTGLQWIFIDRLLSIPI